MVKLPTHELDLLFKGRKELFRKEFFLSPYVVEDKEEALQEFDEYCNLYKNSYILGSSRYKYKNMYTEVDVKNDPIVSIPSWIRDLRTHIQNKTPIYPLLDLLRYNSKELIKGFYIFLLENIEDFLQYLTFNIWLVLESRTKIVPYIYTMALSRTLNSLLGLYQTRTEESYFSFVFLDEEEEGLLYNPFEEEEISQETLDRIDKFLKTTTIKGMGSEKIDLLPPHLTCSLMTLARS